MEKLIDIDYEKAYKQIVKQQPFWHYAGPEQEGRMIQKFTILKSIGNLSYSNSTSVAHSRMD